MSGLLLYAAPAAEPVSVAEALAYCRIGPGNLEPAPRAPVAALAAPAAPGNVDNGDHRYLVTFTTAAGETNAGVVTAAVTVADKAVNGQVQLTSIPVGGALVTGRKVYRTAAGGSTYMLAATIANNTATTYTDNLADAGLGAGAPTANTTEDWLMGLFIRSARTAAESALRRALITQTWDYYLDRFPARALRLPFPRLQTVASIAYVDSNGAAQTLPAQEYTVDAKTEPGLIVPAYGLAWPSTREQPNAVTVRYTCGYGGAGDVPAGIKNWMLVRIKTLWENRAELIVDGRSALVALPPSYVDGLLADYAVPNFWWAEG